MFKLKKTKAMKNTRFNPVRSVMQKLKSINSDPLKVCYGFAFGVFMSATPLIGIKLFIALPIVWLVGWNKTACLVGVLQVNYLTGPVFYTLAYFLGKSICGFNSTFVLPEHMNLTALKDIFFGNAEVLLSLTVGGLVLSIPMTIAAYFLAKSLFNAKLNLQST